MRTDIEKSTAIAPLRRSPPLSAALPPAAALTFEPHPRSFFEPQEPLFRLTDERAKLRLFEAAKLAGAIVLTFDAALAEPAPEAFVSDVLVARFGIAGAAIGFDFRFGRN